MHHILLHPELTRLFHCTISRKLEKLFFIHGFESVTHPPVSNDIAERGVKFIVNFNGRHTTK